MDSTTVKYFCEKKEKRYEEILCTSADDAEKGTIEIYCLLSRHFKRKEIVLMCGFKELIVATESRNKIKRIRRDRKKVY